MAVRALREATEYQRIIHRTTVDESQPMVGPGQGSSTCLLDAQTAGALEETVSFISPFKTLEDRGSGEPRLDLTWSQTLEALQGDEGRLIHPSLYLRLGQVLDRSTVVRARRHK